MEPKLAAPGAGLPKAELFIARRLFALRRNTGTRESFTAKFQEERQRIRDLVQPLTPEECARRVLIERVRGLEDSSRYWSVWMTLEHLRIIHTQMARVIQSLARGVEVPGVASTAAVKPNAEVDETVVNDFEKSCDRLIKNVEAAPDLRTKFRYSHPWFGPLDAFGWHALAGGHLEIHRIQIERIIAGLENSHFAPAVRKWRSAKFKYCSQS